MIPGFPINPIMYYFYLRRICGYSPRQAYTSTALWYCNDREDLYRRLSHLRNRQ